MQGEHDIPDAETASAPDHAAPHRWAGFGRAVRKYGIGLPVVFLVLLMLALWGLDTPIGHRMLTDWLDTQETDSGLAINIGRIEGSIYGTARLNEVSLRDTHGVFLRVPTVELDWRPFSWLGLSFWRGDFWHDGAIGRQRLDIRRLILSRGILLRAPILRPSESHSPVLPGFDIRVDRLAVEHLTVAPGMAGATRRVDLQARIDIHRRRALLSLDSHLGGTDRLNGLLDADEANGRFAVMLDYAAPRGGLLAALLGARAGRLVRINGHGDWARWQGSLAATQDGAPLATFGLANRAGHLGLDGGWHSAPLLGPRLAGILGDVVHLSGDGQWDDGVLTGHLATTSPTLQTTIAGALDLQAGRFNQTQVTAVSRAPLPLASHTRLQDVRATAVVAGPFDGVIIRGRITAGRWQQGDATLMNTTITGTARLADGHWAIPLTAHSARVLSGARWADPYLTNLAGTATLRFIKTALVSDNITLIAPSWRAQGVMHGDTGRDAYTLSGQVAGRRMQIGTAGAADARAAITLLLAGDLWKLTAHLDGRMTQVNNSTLATLVGDNPTFAATLEAGGGAGGGQGVTITRGSITGSKLAMNLAGHTSPNGHAALSGDGHQAKYGMFTFTAGLAADGPHADILLADPLPAAGVRGMRVVLTPEAGGGYGLETSGSSTLGPFAGTLGLALSGDGASGGASGGQNEPAARLDVRHFTISNTSVTGAVNVSATGGAQGELALAGGGVAGSLRLAPRNQSQGDQGQGIDLMLTARQAHFGGDTPLTIGNGTLTASGLILRGHTSLTASVAVQGIGKGQLFIGRASANLKLTDGAGQFTAALAGRRGSRFELQFDGAVAPGQVSVAAHGVFAGEMISTPHRAVLMQQSEKDGGGWRLMSSEIDFGHGRAIADGVMANGSSELDLALADMPLWISDIVFADLGLGGTATGLLHYASPREGLPTSQLRLMIHGLTRSGLVVTSRPIDLALVGDLSTEALQVRAVALASGQALGRVQARVDGLPAQGTLVERLRAGHLAAGLRYAGPADALWRLMALDAIDLTGPIDLAADISGSIDAPHIVGSFASQALHLQSALIGIDVTRITTRGGFNGSRLALTTIDGHTAGGGQVVGSGSVNFAGITDGHGPAIDLSLAAHKAQLLARSDMALVASGPIRIVSDGERNIVAGRLTIDSARWRLGQASAASALPVIATRDINRSEDVLPASQAAPWRFMIDAAAPARIRVMGLGLDSEWGANIQLRGTVDAPAITGSAILVNGNYEFAGQHFDLTRGRINFDGDSPPDPRLDIAASTITSGYTVNVTVRGSSFKPAITFSSVPPLPEEELISRLLFGTSVTDISAPEALQLGAALAALHGGGGMDPINKLRSMIGLDRLRIVAADPTIPHQTGVAVGKYIGRRFYVELMTDGHGYTATNLEYRITRWLSLLGSVSTINRQSANVRVSHDY